MKNMLTWFPQGMFAGGTIGALAGLLLVDLPWPEKATAVGLFCLAGVIGGWALAKMREIAQDRRSLNLGVVSGDAVDLVNQKSFLEGTFAEAKSAYREITVHAAAAERHLKTADKDFADGAFAPFWDQIERTANELAAYKNSVEQLGRCVHVYQREALLLENTPDAVPALQLGEHKLPDARPLAERFSALVRQAQTNFQFAMIYEQRKTNQLLYAGFGTLGAAIYALGESVNLSLTQLSKNTNRNLASLLSTSFAQSDFQREIKGRQKDSQQALDRSYPGRLDG
jgi:hypothetical protein